MQNSTDIICSLIEEIKTTLEKDERVAVCHKFQTDKALQIQMKNGQCLNLSIVKCDGGFVIKR